MPKLLVRPNLYTGCYSPIRGGRAAYPGIWRGRSHCWSPVLGEISGIIRNLASPKWTAVDSGSTLTSAITQIGGVPCWKFDGSHGWSLGTSFPFPAPPFSIVYWFYYTSSTMQGTYLDWSDTGNTDKGLWFHHGYNNFNTPVCRYYDGTTGGTRQDWSLTTSANVWTCLAFSIDAAGTLTPYVNAKKGSTYTTGSAAVTHSSDRKIGQQAAFGVYLSAYVAEVACYRRAITANEVRLLSSSPSVAYERLSTTRYFVPTSSAQNVTVSSVANVQLSAVSASLAGSGTASATATAPADMLLVVSAPSIAPSGGAPATASNAANVQLDAVNASVAGSGTASRSATAAADMALSEVSPSLSGSGSAAVSASAVANVQLSAVSPSITAGGNFVNVTNVADMAFSAVSAAIAGSGSAPVAVSNAANVQLNALSAVLSRPGSSPSRNLSLCRWNVLLLPEILLAFILW